VSAQTLDPWLAEHLACPRDRRRLTQRGRELVCEAGDVLLDIVGRRRPRFLPRWMADRLPALVTVADSVYVESVVSP